MKKRALAALAAATMMSASIVSASPLTDYSLGKASVDITYRNTQFTGKDSTGSQDYDSKYNLDFGTTIGLGKDFAFQYNNYNAKSKDTSISGIPGYKVTYKSQEFNVLYKLQKNVAVYTGINQVSGSFTTPTNDYDTKTYDRWQLGLVGTTKLADKLTGYATVAAGDKITKWGVGVGYEFAPHMEFNVDYTSIKADDVEFSDVNYKSDNTAKGLGFGVTYKF